MVRNMALRGGIDGAEAEMMLGVNLWPTPRASDGNGPRVRWNGGPDLRTAVLWPAPTASEGAHGSPNQGGSKGSPGLTAAVFDAAGLFPAPAVNDAKNSLTEPRRGRLRLNPDWVEALMGYPHGWTDIDREAGREAEYPARWLDGTWEEGLPRVTAAKKNRVSRLKCLGNAIVPQTADVLWTAAAAFCGAGGNCVRSSGERETAHGREVQDE